MLRQPSFPAADFDRLKSEALAGIAQAKTNPDRDRGPQLRSGRLSAGPSPAPADLRGVGAADPHDHPRRPRGLPSAAVRPGPHDRRRDRRRRPESSPGRAPEAPRRLAAQPRDPGDHAARPAAPGGARIDRDPGPRPEPGVDRLGPRRRAPPERPRFLRRTGHEPHPGRRGAHQPAQHRRSATNRGWPTPSTATSMPASTRVPSASALGTNPANAKKAVAALESRDPAASVGTA